MDWALLYDGRPIVNLDRRREDGGGRREERGEMREKETGGEERRENDECLRLYFSAFLRWNRTMYSIL